jgi:WD40 repeat protein/serine/threonine protein kinase
MTTPANQLPGSTPTGSAPQPVPSPPPPPDGDRTWYTSAPADPDGTRYSPAPADSDRTRYGSLPLSASSTGSFLVDAAGDPPFGCSQQRCGNYELLREIKKGGMGIVYEARDLRLERRVALKRILPRALFAPGTFERFYREARAAAALHHPGIVPVHEIGEEYGQPFLVMQLANGGSLQQHLADGPLPARLAAEIVQRLAEAVQHAHEHGVIHRDLKPSNVLLHHEGPAGVDTSSSGSMLRGARSSGSLPAGLRVLVTDFGLARLVAGEDLTATGEVMGTPSYMPPEQAVGNRKAVGPLVDVYSLGAVLYALLTARPPFQAATPLEILRQVKDEEPLAPHRLTPGVPLDLEAVCLCCLEKDPARRYGSAAQLAADLGRFLRGEATAARPEGAWGRSRRWVRRNRLVAGLLTTVAAVLLLSSVVSTFFGLKAVQRAQIAARARETAEGQQREAVAARGLALLGEQKAEQEKQKAEQEKQKAEAARAETEAEKQRADDQLRRTELALYAGQLANAQREWQDGNASRAVDILDSCQWNLRSLEFRHLWTLYNSNHQTLRGNDTRVRCVAISPDGKRLVSGSLDTKLKVWDADTGQVVLSFKAHILPAYCVAISPDGKRLVSGSQDKTLKVWDADKGQELLILKGHADAVWCVAISPDGKRLVSGSQDKTLKVWNADTGQEVLTLKGHTLPVTGVAISPDGKRIVSGSDTLKVWDADKGQELLSLGGHLAPIWCVAISPDGKRLVTGSLDKTLKVWDADTGQQLLTLKGHAAPVSCVAISPDGKRLVSGSSDKTLKVWDADKGQELLSLEGHADAVRCAAISPDGKRVVSGSDDKTLKVWDAHKSQQVLTLKGHLSPVWCVAISPDSKRFVSGSIDKTLKVWDADTGR